MDNTVTSANPTGVSPQALSNDPETSLSFPPPTAPAVITGTPPATAPPEHTDALLPAARLGDLLFALFLLTLGFCFFEWGVLRFGGVGLATTLFFLLALFASLFYLRSKGIRQNRKSLLLFLVALAGAAPFVLHGPRNINLAFLLFEMAACLLWVAYSCRTTLASRLSGLIAGDLLNQIFIVPFANFASFFTRPLSLLRSSDSTRAPHTRPPWFPLALAAAGLVTCVPLFGIVVWLLASSDDGFRALVEQLSRHLTFQNIPRYAFEFILGIPVGAYIFGAVVGNAFKHRTKTITAETLGNSFADAHILPRVALYAPLVLFVILYLTYFITMGSYLFSALQSELPDAYTYAQYARRGFFELCGVALINLILLAGIWLFARRRPHEHPPLLRALTAFLSLLTCLLVVTAASKMLLYIDSYGLTPLRVYTTWFMGLMLLVFLLLVAWHIRPFRFARPVIICVVVAILALGLTNTNALIAEHNVQRYLDGRATDVDVELLAQLGDPALPALYRLEEQIANSDDEKLLSVVTFAIEQNHALHQADADTYSSSTVSPSSWSNWNLSRYQALNLHASHRL
jgi:Ca2+/Na+ antiporter